MSQLAIPDKDTVQIHGSIPYEDLRILGIGISEIIDFSATVNPYSLPKEIRRLISSDYVTSYPDRKCYEAVRALAAFHELPQKWITVTAGTTETIFILPNIYKSAIQFVPTYGDYAEAYRRCGNEIIGIKFPASDLEFDTVVDELTNQSFELLIICNPNNPNGLYLPVHRIRELCERFGHATVCIDESYQEMGENCESALSLTARFENLLILKSLTKPFGLGGLRAGYAVSSGEILRRIERKLLPWGVSSIAQRVIPLLTSNYIYFEQQWADILDQKKEMLQSVSKKGFSVVSGKSPFFLVKTGNAEHTRMRLLKEHHIAVRSCASFGMPDWIRIMPGRPEQNTYLLAKLRDGVE